MTQLDLWSLEVTTDNPNKKVAEWVQGDMGVNPKIWENHPNHPLKNRVFHYFHHPFWGPTPIFGNIHIHTTGGSGSQDEGYVVGITMVIVIVTRSPFSDLEAFHDFPLYKWPCYFHGLDTFRFINKPYIHWKPILQVPNENLRRTPRPGQLTKQKNRPIIPDLVARFFLGGLITWTPTIS